MSRGLGSLQHSVLSVLHEGAVNEGLPIGKLKSLVGGERANLRRAVRSLVRRGLLGEVEVGRKRLVRLTSRGALMKMSPPEKEPDPLAELRIQSKAKKDRLRALKRERARLQAVEAQERLYRKPRPIRRRRRLGQTQKQILAVLAQGIGGEFRALETTYLKFLVGGDRSNLRRAIKTLRDQGYIEERSIGGRRYYELTLVGYVRAVPPDPSTAPRVFGSHSVVV